MAMVAGNVSVDDSGNATFTPDDATNCAKARYLSLLAADSGTPDMMPSTSTTPASVTFHPDGTHTLTPATQSTTQVPIPPGPNNDATKKKAFAKTANADAAWIVPFLQASAQAKIANDASADGLQNGTVHPASAKFLPIV